MGRTPHPAGCACVRPCIKVGQVQPVCKHRCPAVRTCQQTPAPPLRCGSPCRAPPAAAPAAVAPGDEKPSVTKGPMFQSRWLHARLTLELWVCVEGRQPTSARRWLKHQPRAMRCTRNLPATHHVCLLPAQPLRLGPCGRRAALRVADAALQHQQRLQRRRVARRRGLGCAERRGGAEGSRGRQFWDGLVVRW